MKKHKLWSSEINIEDWKDFLEEEYPDVDDEHEQYQLCVDLNNDYLDDERANLEKPMNILVIGDLGHWNGTRTGYMKLKNFSDVFCSRVNGCSEIEFFVEDNDMKAIEHHHDGTNYYTFYEIREDRMCSAGFERFLADICSG